MEKTLKQYFNQELEWTAVALAKELDPARRHDITWFAIQRCLGSSNLAQFSGLSYSVVESMFEWVKQELEEMRDAL